MPSPVKMRTLLETGVHFGHRTNRWNPKMDEFIFTARNGIHIIDLQQTLVNLNEYYDMVRDLIADGGSVLFCGTKRQAQETIEQEARRCGMPYVNQRWLGGTLTNWKTIRSRIDTMKQLEKDREEGVFELLTKKEALINERKIQKLQIRLGGLRDMRRVPDMVIIVDTDREHTAVHECNILKIPILGIVDTNANPDSIDYIIPGNDDAMRSIRLLVGAMADAVLEG
ncbi:MAG: 30S ribosomal protein S2 [Chloroflexota bacterium]